MNYQKLMLRTLKVTRIWRMKVAWWILTWCLEVEGLIVEVERPGVASEDVDAEKDAHRTGMAPRGDFY